IGGIGDQRGEHLRSRLAAEAPVFALPPLMYEFRQLLVVIGEVVERPRRGVFLSLEEHGRAGAEEQISGERAEPRRAAQLMQPMAARGIGDLIVVLQIDDEAVVGRAEGGLAAPPSRPAVLLPLEQVASRGG